MNFFISSGHGITHLLSTHHAAFLTRDRIMAPQALHHVLRQSRRYGGLWWA